MILQEVPFFASCCMTSRPNLPLARLREYGVLGTAVSGLSFSPAWRRTRGNRFKKRTTRTGTSVQDLGPRPLSPALNPETANYKPEVRTPPPKLKTPCTGHIPQTPNPVALQTKTLCSSSTNLKLETPHTTHLRTPGRSVQDPHVQNPKG